MSDMTLTMTFKAVDEATAVMKNIMSAEKEMQTAISAGATTSGAAAEKAAVAAERQVTAIDRVAAAAKEATKAIVQASADADAAQASVDADVATSTHGDRVWLEIAWAEDTPAQTDIKTDLQNLRDLADQQRMFREDESFAQSLIDGLGGAVPDAVANAITPPEPPPPAWSDRKFGPVEWADDTPTQAQGREEVRLMRAFAAEAEAAAELERQLAPLKDTATDIADAMGGIGGNAEPAAGGLRSLGAAAGEAIPNLIEAAKGLVQTEGLAREFAVAFGRVAGSLGSALLVTGVEFAVSQMIGFVHEAVTGEKELERALKNHASIVKEVGTAYRQTKDAAGEYRGMALEALEFKAQQNATRMEEIYAASLDKLVSAKALEEPGFLSPLADLGPFSETIAEWKQAVEDGREGARDLQRRIGEVAVSLPDEDVFRRRQAEVILIQTEDALANELQLEDARRTYRQATEARASAGTSRDIANASTELQTAVDVAAEVEPAMRAAADGIDQGSRAFSEVDPAASGAASSIGSAADEISRVSQNAQAAANDLAQLTAAMRDVSASRISVPAAPISTPVAANANLPGFSAGGYTGDIPVNAIAGYVHGREFVFDADETAAIGRDRLAALAASPELLSTSAARSRVAGLLVDGGGSGPISVQMNAPVTIAGNASRADIERDVLDVMEKSGRRLGEIIDEEMRRKSRRQH